MNPLTITLPWPPKELSPNARLHWSKLAKAKKTYRAVCALQARAQGAKPINAKKVHLSLMFYPPTRRAFDLDNAFARMKSGFDGLADVLEVDDRHWGFSFDRAEEIGGMVKVVVTHE